MTFGESNDLMKTHRQPAAHPIKRLLASLMVAMLFVHPLLSLAEVDETPAPHPIILPAPPDEDATSVPEGQPQLLQIDILDGEGALNNIRQRTAREPIVEVKDENHKPVAGALILLTVQPGDGGAGPLFGSAASASFQGSGSISLYTDASGQAVGRGLIPNDHTGSYTIKVTAIVGAVTATAIIHQHNVRGAYAKESKSNNAQTTSNNGTHGHSSAGKIIKWTLVGAAVVVTVVLIYVLTRGHSTTVTAGPGSVGVP